MKRLLLLLAALLLITPAATAQSMYIYPTTTTSAQGGTPTVTAIVNGANDKTVTWSVSPAGATLVGKNPCTANGDCTIGVTAPSAGTYTLTATSNANGSVTKTATVTFTGSPTVNTSHPRLMLTPSLVTSLHARAVSASNCNAATDLAYRVICNRAVTLYNGDNGSSAWGTGNTTGGAGWSYLGGNGQPATGQGMKEEDATYFAYMAMVDAAIDGSFHWQSAAHDVGMYTIGQVNGGSYSWGGNDWSDSADFHSWMVDWMLGAGSMTTDADKSAARSYLYNAAKNLTNNGNGVGGILNAPINDVAQFTTNTSGASYNPNQLNQQRAMGNNYSWSKLQLYTAIGFTFDDSTTDDPALTNTCSATRYDVCSDYTAGSLHAYAHWLMGAWMLKAWAHLEDPDVVQQALNSKFPSGGFSTQPQCQWWTGENKPCFGDGREGESSEGSWYQYSFYKLTQVFIMLHTAGVDDPAVWGPQASLANSSWTDLKYLSDYSFLTGWGGNNNWGSGNPAYNYFTTGDASHYVRWPADFGTELGLMAYDSLVGRTDRSNALWWLPYNAAFGHGKGTDGGCTGGYCGFDNELGTDFRPSIWDYNLARPAGDDPQTGTQPTDPRSTFPTDLYNNSFNQHQLVRDNWTENGSTIFSAYCPNTIIDHEYQFCGRFDVNVGGEYITKGRTQFNDYNYAMSASLNSNTAAYVSSGSGNTNKSWAAIAYGGQFNAADRAGFASVQHSELPSYTSFMADDGGVYNGAQSFNTPYDVPGYNNVASASADIIYIRPGTVVRYDRGAFQTGTAVTNLYLNTTGPTTVTGNVASWTTRSGNHKAYFTSILGGTLSANETSNYVEFTAPHGTLQVGTTMQGTCLAHNASGTTTDISSIANWRSEDTSILTVSSTGLITAVATGSTNIHCDGPVGQGTWTLVSASSAASTGSVDAINDQDETADWEVYKQLQVSGGTVASKQYLSTLTWGDSTFNPTTPTSVSSSSGITFDGAKIGSTVAMFMRTKGAFTSVTYPASGATTHYVADLVPNTTYTVSGSGAPTSATTDSAGVLTFASDGTGNVAVSNGSTTSGASTIGLNNNVGAGVSFQ